MRRLAPVFVLAALAAAALATAAAAKEGVELSSTPAGLGPGDPWNLGIQVMAEPGVPAAKAAPVVRILNDETGFSRSYRAKPLGGTPDTFVTTIRFPEEGYWRYTVRHNGVTFEFDHVVIEEPTPTPAPSGPSSDPQPAPSAAGADDGGFPLWPVLAGSLAAALLAGAGLAWLRGRRLPPWPAAPSSARTASRGR
jgi:hypothetical protein